MLKMLSAKKKKTLMNVYVDFSKNKTVGIDFLKSLNFLHCKINLKCKTHKSLEKYF